MRVASRHMPPVTRHPLAFAGRLLIACLFAGGVFIAVALAKPASALVVSGVLVAFILLGYQESKREARKVLALASAREGQTICEFARDFDTRAVDTWVVRAVYEQVQGQLRNIHPCFPLRADDRLKEDLLLDDDDLDMDLAPEVAERTGRSLDGSDRNPYFGKVKTVRDFVLFFQHQPKSTNSAARCAPNHGAA